MALRKLEDAFEEFKAYVAGGAPDLGVPQGITITDVRYVTPKLAVITVGWDAVEGADGYDVEHEFGSPYVPFMRLIEHVRTTSCTIGGERPFLVAPGGPYTVAVFPTIGVKRSAVSGVAELQVPAYTPPEPSFPTPVASIAGEIVNDSLVVELLIGPPGADTQPVKFRHTQDPDVADTGSWILTIDSQTAAQLGLPNEGPLQATGVGGTVTGYYTHVDVEFGPGGHRDNNVGATVLDGFSECLVGLKYAVDRKLIVAVDTVRATLSYYKA